jgi:hypothetical protein
MSARESRTARKALHRSRPRVRPSVISVAILTVVGCDPGFSNGSPAGTAHKQVFKIVAQRLSGCTTHPFADGVGGAS